MTAEHSQILRALGFQPERCTSIGHEALGRHGVFQCAEQIIKLYGNGTPPAADRARAEQLYTARARENGICAPRVLRAGTVLGVSYTISQRLDGVIASSPPSDEIVREMGVMLGKLHRPALSEGATWRSAWLQELRHAVQKVHDSDAGLEALTLCDKTLAYLESTSPLLFALLPMGTVHGDFSTRNVLCMDGTFPHSWTLSWPTKAMWNWSWHAFIRRSCTALPPASPPFKRAIPSMRFLPPGLAAAFSCISWARR